MVSEKHCNFLINTGDATAADIEALGEEVRRRVSRRRSASTCEWEIRRIGVPAGGVKELPHEARRRPDGRSVGRARGVAGQRPRLRRRPAGGRLRRLRRSTSAATSWRWCARWSRGPTWSSTRCTAASARTAASRACSNLLGIPYTHSGVLASALAMDKPMAKRVFAAAGIRCPDGSGHGRPHGLSAAIPSPRALRRQADQRRLQRRRHASCARATTSRVRDRASNGSSAPRVAGRALHPRPRAHRRRDGRPRAGRDGAAVSHTASTTTRPNTPTARTDHLIPAPIPQAGLSTRRCAWRKLAHEALGCRGVSRSDFRYDDTAERRAESALSARGQHAARHDAAVAGARAGASTRHLVPRAGRLDGGERAMRRLIAAIRSCGRTPCARAQGPARASPTRPQALAARQPPGRASGAAALRCIAAGRRRRDLAGSRRAAGSVARWPRLGDAPASRPQRRCSASRSSSVLADGRNETTSSQVLARRRRAAGRADLRRRSRGGARAAADPALGRDARPSSAACRTRSTCASPRPRRWRSGSSSSSCSCSAATASVIADAASQRFANLLVVVGAGRAGARRRAAGHAGDASRSCAGA